MNVLSRLCAVSFSLGLAFTVSCQNALPGGVQTQHTQTPTVSARLLKGQVAFPGLVKTFRTQALPTDVNANATVSILYPHDHPTQANTVIATGLTDTSGAFGINPDASFAPGSQEVFVLEALKRDGGAGSEVMSMRTFIRWNGTAWESITTPDIVINETTTALSIIANQQNTELAVSNTMGTVVISGGESVPQAIGTITVKAIQKVAELTRSVLARGQDPFAEIQYVNSDYGLDQRQFLERLAKGEGCPGCNLSGADLSKVSLARQDLSYADLSNVDLSDANLQDTVLIGVKLTNATLPVSLAYLNLEEADLTGQDLRDIDLTGASLAYAKLENADLSGTSPTERLDLTKTRWTGAKFNNADLQYADLSGVYLLDAEFTNAKIAYSDFSGADLTGVDFQAVFNTDITGVKLVNANLAGSDFSGLNLTTIDSQSLAGAKMSGAIFVNANLSGINLAGQNLYATVFRGANFQYGTSVNNPRLLNANLRNADLSEANLSYMNLSNINFTNSDLSSAVLTGTNLTGTIFRGANLQNAMLDAQVMSKIDFVSADLRGIQNLKSIVLDSDFSYADMSGLNLEAKSFSKSTAAGSPGCKFKGTIFNATSFSNGTNGSTGGTGTSFAGANLSGQDFSNKIMDAVNFTNTNLTGANLSSSRFFQANFTGASPQNLSPGVGIANADFRSATWTNGTVCSVNSPAGQCTP